MVLRWWPMITEYQIDEYVIVPRTDGVDIITPEPTRERLFATRQQVKAIYQFLGRWKLFGIGTLDEAISFGPLHGHTVVVRLSFVPLWCAVLQIALLNMDRPHANQTH